MSIYYVDPAATGANSGASWTDGWTNVQTAFDTAVAGDVVYCRGTQTFTSATQIDIDTNGGANATGFIKFIGCNASGSVDGTRFVIDVANYAAHGLDFNTLGNYVWLENFEVKRAGTGKNGVNRIGGGTCTVFANCSFHDCAGIGCKGDFGQTLFHRCTAYNNGSYGFSVSGTALLMQFCSAHDNTGSGVYAPQTLFGCMMYGNGDDGASNMTNSRMIQCVVDGNADDGVLVSSHSSSYFSTLTGNRITNHSGSGDVGLNCGGEVIIGCLNYFENNDGANVQNASLYYSLPGASDIEDQSNTNTGYTSLTDGSENFNLRSDASLRRTAVSIPTS